MDKWVMLSLLGFVRQGTTGNESRGIHKFPVQHVCENRYWVSS